MGLIKEGDDYIVLTDILGDEDHLGDMDFKVAGTTNGITALQMDIKITGITGEIMAQALTQAKAARLHILGQMNQVLPKPREQLSPFAPRISTIKINPDKIREVIGKGGATIQSITRDTGTQIDIDDDGTIKIAAVDGKAAEAAVVAGHLPRRGGAGPEIDRLEVQHRRARPKLHPARRPDHPPVDLVEDEHQQDAADEGPEREPSLPPPFSCG
mgnify:CR=1 FL=1